VYLVSICRVLHTKLSSHFPSFTSPLPSIPPTHYFSCPLNTSVLPNHLFIDISKELPRSSLVDRERPSWVGAVSHHQCSPEVTENPARTYTSVSTTMAHMMPPTSLKTQKTPFDLLGHTLPFDWIPRFKDVSSHHHITMETMNC